MIKYPSVVLRVAYCLIVLGAVLPIGIASSGWVRLATGPSRVSAVPVLGLLFALALGGFRIYSVARFPTTLSSPPASGFTALARVLGTMAMYVGVVGTVLNWIARPLMRALLTSRGDSGAEFFAVGLLLSLVGSIGLLGLLLFEFSRLLAFERLTYQRYGAKKGA